MFSDAGIEVDLASPKGGEIAVDPMSLRAVPRSEYDDRFLADTELRSKVRNSICVSDIEVDDYDVIFFSGGWGAAFDLGFSDVIGEKVTEANAKNLVLGGVCHGPLGFLKAKDAEGNPLVKGRRITAVTDKQVRELGIETTPHHPEKELRELGADFQCTHRRRDPLANHWEVDGNIVTGQNQNAGPMVAREIMKLLDEGRSLMKQTFEGKIGRTLEDSEAWFPEPPHPGEDAPNVIFVLLDDTGFAQFGCYGSEIDTENVNSLAQNGLQFTNFHVTPLCSPTRASLLTGRSQHAVGMRGVSNWQSGFPHQLGHISNHAGTIAEVLSSKGYATFCTGKWHLAPMEDTSAAGPFDQIPVQSGFDRFYGFLEGETDQFHPELTVDNHYIDPPRALKRVIT